VLQQLERPEAADVSVNDALRPVSRYFDRIERPEQLIAALPAAMRVLTSPSETGAVTIALPQDVQAEAHDWPAELLEPRTWIVPRQRPDADLVARTPVIETDPEGAVAGIHFNNRSMAPLDLPEAEIEPWYCAYRDFAATLRRPEGEVRLRLMPGDLVMMMNQRALHGRTAFDPNRGRRHLQGCYIAKDGVGSRLRILERTS